MNINLEQVIAAVTLKIQKQEELLKNKEWETRLACVSCHSELLNILRDAGEKQIDSFGKTKILNSLFPSRRGDFRFEPLTLNNNFFEYCYVPPTDFLDYETGGIRKCKQFDISTEVNLKVDASSEYAKNCGGFSFYIRIKLPNSGKVKECLQNWLKNLAEYKTVSQKIKALNTFKKNLNQECQLILLELQNPSEYQCLVQFVDYRIENLV
jgi:hypothetical protein